SPETVILPAGETAILSEAVADSVGPPLKPSNDPAPVLADKLSHTIAVLDKRLEQFKEDNNENAGKKIEGTGLLQIPYFV
ncbi:hypothetical protein, partial [Streptococcus pneumoniae]|uniref:hypothetical protein n=1 Tax=Streptococcus pneumoniae TaxID=1313 RepID=UPI0018B02D14